MSDVSLHGCLPYECYYFPSPMSLSPFPVVIILSMFHYLLFQLSLFPFFCVIISLHQCHYLSCLGCPFTVSPFLFLGVIVSLPCVPISSPSVIFSILQCDYFHSPNATISHCIELSSPFQNIIIFLLCCQYLPLPVSLSPITSMFPYCVYYHSHC